MHYLTIKLDWQDQTWDEISNQTFLFEKICGYTLQFNFENVSTYDDCSKILPIRNRITNPLKDAKNSVCITYIICLLSFGYHNIISNFLVLQKSLFA